MLKEEGELIDQSWQRLTYQVQDMYVIANITQLQSETRNVSETPQLYIGHTFASLSLLLQ
ncbi:hypothetical protein VV208B2_10490 [Vibrio vulnificus]|nr:hypothetical protein VV208B2_10490 [Vibrio vulnificus]